LAYYFLGMWGAIACMCISYFVYAFQKSHPSNSDNNNNSNNNNNNQNQQQQNEQNQQQQQQQQHVVLELSNNKHQAVLESHNSLYDHYF